MLLHLTSYCCTSKGLRLRAQLPECLELTDSLSPLADPQETCGVGVHERLEQLRAQQSLPRGYHTPQHGAEPLPELSGFSGTEAWNELQDSHRVVVFSGVVDVNP